MQRTAFAPAARTRAVSVAARASAPAKARNGTAKTAVKSRPGTTKTTAPKVNSAQHTAVPHTTHCNAARGALRAMPRPRGR